MAATVAGIDTDTWGVIVAALALAVAIYGALVARRSATSAEHSAGAAERSADATVAAADASARAAEAAERSAVQAERSAGAAERSADAQERAVALEHDRARHEQRDRIGRDAPRWEPLGEHESAWWVSDDDNLLGVLVNAGKTSATVTDVEVQLPRGGSVVGRFRAEPAGRADGGYVSSLAVRPGGAVAVHFETPDGSLGAGLAGEVRPQVHIQCSSEELGWSDTRRVELLPRPGGKGPRWLPRAIE